MSAGRTDDTHNYYYLIVSPKNTILVWDIAYVRSRSGGSLSLTRVATSSSGIQEPDPSARCILAPNCANHTHISHVCVCFSVAETTNESVMCVCFSVAEQPMNMQ